MSDGDPLRQRLISALVMVLALYAIAVPFYVIVEGLTVLVSMYFVTVSITSAGYGDITPKTDLGKMFSIFLLLSGVSIFFYHVTHFGQFREKAIDPHVQRRLQILRNLTSLQTGEVKTAEIRKIREKINPRQRSRNKDRDQGFGGL